MLTNAKMFVTNSGGRSAKPTRGAMAGMFVELRHRRDSKAACGGAVRVEERGLWRAQCSKSR